MKDFIVTSYYTIDTGYQQEVKSLRDSLDRHNIKSDIRGIESKGSWQKNTRHKAKFLREMLDIYPEYNIVWIDADAVVLRYPGFFKYIDADAAFYFRTNGGNVYRISEGCELLSGTIFLQNNDQARKLVDMWIFQNQREFVNLEQYNLQVIVGDWRKQGGKLAVLPQSYCKIFDADNDWPVVTHSQASRRFRHEVDR